MFPRLPRKCLQMGGVGTHCLAETMEQTVATPDVLTGTRTRRSPPYNVILLNDDDHTFDYVIAMLKSVFGHPRPTGVEMAVEVHMTGRVIVATTHREKAEMYREHVHAYGADPLIERCSGSMTAILEPAEGA